MTRPETAHVKVCETDDCPVCETWRAEMRARARRHVVERVCRPDHDQQTLDEVDP